MRNKKTINTWSTSWIGLLALSVFAVGCSKNDEPKSIESVFTSLLSSNNCTGSTTITLIPGGKKHVIKGQNSSFSFSIPETNKSNTTLVARVCSVSNNTISHNKISFPVTDILHLTNIQFGSEDKTQLTVVLDSNINGVSQAIDYQPISKLFRKETVLSSDEKGFIGFLSEINESETALFGTSEDFVSELQSNQGELFGIKDIGNVTKKTEEILSTIGEETVRIKDKALSMGADELRDRIYGELSATPAGILCKATLSAFALTTAIEGDDVELPFSLRPTRSSVCNEMDKYTPETMCSHIGDQAFKEACKYAFSDFLKAFVCITSRSVFRGFEFLLALESCNKGDSLSFCLFFNQKQLCGLAALVLAVI